MSKNISPKYRCQKSGSTLRAFVELGGVRHYLGVYGTPDSKQEYHRLLSEWSASGGHLPVEKTKLTLVELVARFWMYAKGYYVRPTEALGRIENFKP